MLFTESEIDELASFFAKRFPRMQDRCNLADKAGLFYVENSRLDAKEAWRKLLIETQEQGKMSRLGVAAERAAGDDALLGEVSGLLNGRMPRSASSQQIDWSALMKRVPGNF